MRPDLLDIIACPVCKGPLVLRVDSIAPADAAGASVGETLSGALTCRLCNESYPIADGIPNLLPPELRDVGPFGTGGAQP